MLDPRSPYSASKAAAEHLAFAYYHSFNLPVIVTRASNNYGPYQFPEKFIPLMIMNALASKEMPIYGDGLYVRDWLYVKDHCHGLILASRNGRVGQVYNIGGNNEVNNLQVVEMIIDSLSRLLDVEHGEFRALLRHVADRPGHDRRYALDNAKAGQELGFAPQTDFKTGLDQTVEWYLHHYDWWGDNNSGAQLWLRR